METLTDIRNAARSGQPVSLYGAIRLLTSTDHDAATAYNIMVSNEGYDALLAFGFSTTVATRIAATYYKMISESGYQEKTVQTAIKHLHMNTPLDTIDVMIQALGELELPVEGPIKDAAIHIINNYVLSDAGKLAMAHRVIGNTPVAVLAWDKQMVVPDLPLPPAPDPNVVAVYGWWTDPALIDKKIKVNSRFNDLYSSTAGIRSAFANFPISKSTYIELVIPKFIDPNQWFGFVPNVVTAENTAQQIGNVDFADSYGINCIGQIKHNGVVQPDVIPVITPGSVVGLAVSQDEAGICKLFLAINGVWQGDPGNDIGMIFSDLATDMRLAVSTYLAGTEHKISMVSDPNTLHYPAPPGYEVVNVAALVPVEEPPVEEQVEEPPVEE